MEDGEIFFVLLLIVASGLAIRYYTQKARLQKEKVDLLYLLEKQKDENRKLKSESLRFQLTPHAFRNTLSSLKYFTTMADKAVNHLSDVLDYLLYESKSDVVTIRQELIFLEEFVDLYKMRINNINAVSFNHSISDTHPLFNKAVLPPLITAYFIENAFKHGDLEGDKTLSINIEIVGNEFVYIVKNRVNNNKEIKKGGIGQKNIAERLDILFNGKYKLNYELKDNYYISTLKLYL